MPKSYTLIGSAFASIMCSAIIATATNSIAQSGPIRPSSDQYAALRPASVPATHVPTPFGWVSRACVTQLKPGETFKTAKKTRSPTIGKCTGERFDNLGAPLRRNVPRGQLAATPDYKAIATVAIPAKADNSSAITHMIVPPKPSSTNYQIGFYNTGINDENPGGAIIFTSITWNLDTDLQWKALIYLDSPGTDELIYTHPVDVKPGDELVQKVTAARASENTLINASIENKATGEILTKETFNRTNFTPSSIMNIGMEILSDKKCNSLPKGDIIHYPYVEASISIDGGPLKDVSDQMTVRRPPLSNPCKIILTLDEASQTEANFTTQKKP